jgi:hypothetical protein
MDSYILSYVKGRFAIRQGHKTHGLRMRNAFMTQRIILTYVILYVDIIFGVPLDINLLFLITIVIMFIRYSN